MENIWEETPTILRFKSSSFLSILFDEKKSILKNELNSQANAAFSKRFFHKFIKP